MTAAPRRRLHRGLLLAVGLAGVLSAGAWVVHTPWFGRQLARLLEAVLERTTGEEAVVGGVQLALVDRTVSVQGLVLRHHSLRPEHDGRTIVAVEEVVIALGLRGGRPRIRRVEIERPSLQLHLDEGRLREFPLLQSQKGNGNKATELPWDELYLRDGSVSLSATYGGKALLQLDLEGLDAAPGATDGTMMVDAGMVRFSLGEVTQAATAVHLPDLVVGPQRIHAPAIRLDFPDLAVHGALDLSPGGPVNGLFTIGTRLEAWAPLMPGRVSASGEVKADVELSGQANAPVLGGALLARDLVLILQPPPSCAGRPPLHYALGDLVAAWRVHERQLLLEPLEVAWAGGQLRIDAAADLASKGAWASITAVDLDLSEALVAMDVSKDPWVDMRADLEIQAAGTLQPLRLAGSWTLAATDLRAASGPVSRTAPMLAIPRIRARGQLGVDPEGLDLIARPLSTPRSQGRIDARIGFGPVGPLALDLSLDRLDMRDLAPLADMGLAGTGSLTGHLGGPFNKLGADAVLDVRGLELWGLPFADQARSTLTWRDMVHLSFPDIRGQRGETPLLASVDLEFRQDTQLDLQLLVPGGRLSDVMGIFLDLPGVDAQMQGSLELRGPVGALDGESRVELQQVELYGERFDRGEATGWMDQGRFTLDEAAIWRRGGLETLVARGSVGAGWAANLDVRAGGFRLEELDQLADLGGTLRGELHLDAAVGGTLFEPEPRGELRLRDTRLARQLVPDSALSFETRDGVLFFGGQLASGAPAPPYRSLTGALDPKLPSIPGSMRVAGTLGLWQDQPYTIQARLDRFPVSLLYAEAPDGSPVDMRLGGQARIAGRFGETPTPVAILAEMDQTSLTWGRHQLVAPGPWRWEQEGEDFMVQDLALQGGATDLRFSGERRRAGPTAFSGGGTLDLDLLRLVVPGLERAEGTGEVAVRAVSLDGRVRPEVEVQAEGLTIRGDWFPATFEDVSARVRATPDLAVLESVQGRLGGGLISGQGSIDLERYLPRRYDLSARGQDVRVRYFDFLPPVQGDAALTFTGPSDSPLLSGRLTVTDMLFSERIDWESWMLEVSDEVLSGAVQEEGQDWFSMELAIDADQTLRVRNNVADLTASGQLRVMGDTARPGLVGRVRAEPGGRVYLKEREFELLRGELRFVDPFAYDPELDFALTTDVRSSEQEYRIDVQVAGNWTDWHTTTRSDPNLPQADVNALLVFGMTREEMERTGALGQALAIEGSDVLFSSIGIVERAGEGIFRLRGLQPVLDPLRPERLDLVSGTSERGSGTVSSELRLLYENDLEDVGWRGGLLLIEQSVSGGQDTYVGLEQRLARRLYLRGFWTSEQVERSLDMQGAFGAEVNVRWELD